MERYVYKTGQEGIDAIVRSVKYEVEGVSLNQCNCSHLSG